MMTKQEKLLWTLLAGVLVILFLLSSTDLIIKEKKTEIYPVSVIIGDTTDDYYVNFRKGADKAAVEYNVDV
ncbi:MAG TPA: sugar ABC transporter substrate-binding protein, partial [Lachnoclostridium sp.]|nr:sugar ABC transporter substrate-binding protein [Lachnoclostridium sp.]